MRAARPVTGLAAGAERVGPFSNEARMVGGGEIAVDFIVALFALLGADVFRSWHIGQHNYSTVHRVAGHYREKWHGQQSDGEDPARAHSQDLAQRASFAICHGGVWLSFGLAND